MLGKLEFNKILNEYSLVCKSNMPQKTKTVVSEHSTFPAENLPCGNIF